MRRIQNTENPNTSQARTEVLGYGYDQWKRQTAQYVAGKNYRFQYDDMDQLTGVQYPAASNQPAMNVSYTYDAAGRMQTVSTPGMGTATYQYTTGSSGNGWRNQYRVTYANGHSWETRRDAFGELTKVEHAKTANQVTTSLYTEEQYSHDGLGNIAGLTKRMKSASGAEYDDLRVCV